MSKIVIFGNKATARESFFSLKYFSHFEIAGFTVDNEYLDSDTLLGLPVVPFEESRKRFSPETHRMLVAVGYVQNNRIRKERYAAAKQMGYQFISFVSPKSITHPETVIGENCLIGHYTVISADARVGNNVIIGNGCTIGHDVLLGDHCFLSNGVSIAGRVNIGECCYLGTNSTIRNKVSIGKECVIGAGAILLENAEDRSVYLGEPATLLPITSDELPLG